MEPTFRASLDVASLDEAIHGFLVRLCLRNRTRGSLLKVQDLLMHACTLTKPFALPCFSQVYVQALG